MRKITATAVYIGLILLLAGSTTYAQQCDVSFNLGGSGSVSFDLSQRAPFNTLCVDGLLLFDVDTNPSKGTLEETGIDRMGSFTYTAPAGGLSGPQTARISVTCNFAPSCTGTITFVGQAPATTTVAPTPPPTVAVTPSPPSPVPSCGTPQVVNFDGPQGREIPIEVGNRCDGSFSARVANKPSKGIFITVGKQMTYVPADAQQYTGGADLTIMCGSAVECVHEVVIIVNPATTTTAAPPTTVATTQVPPTTTAVPPAPVATDAPRCNTVSGSATNVGVVQGEIGINRECGLGLSVRVKSLSLAGASLVFTSGSQYEFVAPAGVTGNVIASLAATCGGQPLCDLTFVLIVDNPSPVLTPVPPQVPNTPDGPAQTPAPPVPRADVGSCGAPLVFTRPVSSTVEFSLRDQLQGRCTDLTFTSEAGSLNGNFQINLRGEINYGAPPNEAEESVDVVALCFGTPNCRQRLVFQSYRILTPVPTPRPTSSSAPAQCPRKLYYYYVEPAKVASASLRGRLGEPVCDGFRQFALNENPKVGVLQMHLNGDFTYSTPSTEDLDDFAFTMKCGANVLCVGRAYIMISNVSRTDAPVEGTRVPRPMETAAPVTYNPTQYQKCRGTCRTGAWNTLPTRPNVWDITPGAPILPRDDNKPIGTLDASWKRGQLELSMYGKLGGLSQRFPTFEPIRWTDPSAFTTSDVLAQAAPQSLAFNATCLNNQPTDMGMGEDVWKVPEGTLGTRYRRGGSWYQKFGGAHDNCDTYADSCVTAPLLTPRVNQNANREAEWSVDINNCDTTWKGTVSYSAIRNQQTAAGTNVWSVDNDRHLQATLYSEAVKPANWLDPTKGYMNTMKQYQLSIRLSEWITTMKVDTATSSDAPFTFDPKFFEYRADNGDRAFGINLIFYPAAAEGEATRFTADRRVRGFRVLSQTWFTPDDAQCPTCANKGLSCSIDARQDEDSQFLADNFQRMSCTNGGQPRIQLFKGPMTTSADCKSDADNIIFGRRGFSAPQSCAVSFQNLTIRGIATGSGNSSGGFDYEGTILLQLLLSNGNRATVSVDISLYVSALATEGSFQGEVEICRASPYWPVLDPLGTSLPDDRHPLAPKLPDDQRMYLCIDQRDNAFGPEGWAVAGFTIEGYNSTTIRIEQVGVRYPGSPDVFFIHNNPATGAPAPVSEIEGTFWTETHPFFNFRDVTYRLANNTITSPDGPVLPNADFAFAFNPGAIAVETDVDLFGVFLLFDESGNVIGRPTLRQKIHIDPLLSAQSRYGPTRVLNVDVAVADESPFFFFIVSGIIIGVIALGAVALAKDNDRPLPKWIPRPDNLPNLISLPGRKKKSEATSPH